MTPTDDSQDDVKAQWPSVDAAFTFVLPSYQMLTNRFEAADTRLTTLLTFACTITSAAPLIGKTIRQDAPFQSPLLWAALGVFVVTGILGILARVRGTLLLPDPSVLHDQHLGKSESAFKVAQLYWAGEHFTHNRAAILAKGQMANVVTMGLVLEVALLMLWLSV